MSAMTRMAQCVAALAVLFVFTGIAKAETGWTLIQTVGEVMVTPPGAQPIAAKPATAVPDGSTVRTGGTGRAVLLRGRETIVMSPMSVVTLPSGANRDVSQVKQQSGTLLFKIGKKPEAHFEVDTPYLAAVVKGTTFTVNVNNAGASVHVIEGAVEVATVDRKHAFLTRAGQISSVFAQAVDDIFTTGASVLSAPAESGELWGTDVSGFAFGGEDNEWTTEPKSKVFGDSGLRASVTAPGETNESVTDRERQKLFAAFEAVGDTLSASSRSNETEKPKDGSVKISAHDETRPKDKQAGKPVAQDARARTRKAKPVVAADPDGDEMAARRAANVWTVTQAKGHIEIDGYPFANFGDGLVRSLPPGTKVETGADSKLGVAFGATEFVVEENSLVVLGDPAGDAKPKVVSGHAVVFAQDSGRYVPVANLSSGQIAELQSRGDLDDAPSKERAELSIRKATKSVQDQVSLDRAAPSIPKIVAVPSATKQKTEEVRTKVLGGLTLGLYALTALLILAFGARWMWTRVRAKAKEPAPETPVQVRLRNIKGA